MLSYIPVFQHLNDIKICLISSFLDKLYVMSSNEALAHFMRNPRPYLAPHLPRPPCKVCVLGPPHSGKTIVAHALAERYNAKVI